MFTKTLLCLVLLLVTLLSVESVKTGGVHSVDYSLARIATKNNLVRDSEECLPILSADQGQTVNNFEETWRGCKDTEIRSNKKLDDENNAFTYKMALAADDWCTKMDQDCRDQYAETKNARAALDCYISMGKVGVITNLNISEESKIKSLDVENQSRSIISTRAQCTEAAGYVYLIDTNNVFDKFLECDVSGVSSTVSTTQSTTLSTPGRPFPTEGTPETSSVTWETEGTTRGRFPWNK